MKFGEQPTYSRQAYEDTEKGVQDVKDAAKGNASVEDLRTLVQEKKTLESQKADLYDQAFDEATEMDRERDALAQERIAKEAADTAEADRLRAEILGEVPVSETASVEAAPVQLDSKPENAGAQASERDLEDAYLINQLVDKATDNANKGAGRMPNMKRIGAKSVEEMDDLTEKLRSEGGQRFLASEVTPVQVPKPVETSRQGEKAPAAVVDSVRVDLDRARNENSVMQETAVSGKPGLFDRVKSFFSGEKKEEPKESVIEGLKNFLGKPKENESYRDMVDEQGNFNIRSAYSNIGKKKRYQNDMETNVGFAGATVGLLPIIGSAWAMGSGIEASAVAAAIGISPLALTLGVPAVAAGAWAGLKLWNMYKRRKALRAADELFLRTLPKTKHKGELSNRQKELDNLKDDYV